MPNVAPGGQSGEGAYVPILVNKMYKAKLSSTGGPDGDYEIETFLPPNFDISLSANWNRPFQSQSVADVAMPALAKKGGRLGRMAEAVGGHANDLAHMVGVSSLSKWTSAAVWNGASEISINLPFEFVAEFNPQQDVTAKVVKLLQMCAPSQGAGGLYTPPGPHITGDTLLNGGRPGGEFITLAIGTFLTFSPCYVASVTTNFDTQFYAGGDGGAEGGPMYAICNVTVHTFWDVTKGDIYKFFNGVGGGAGDVGG